MAACDLCKKLESENGEISNPNYINTDQSQRICPTCISGLKSMTESFLTQNQLESGNGLIRRSPSRRLKPTVEIVVQPMKSYRFRFETEHIGTAIFPLKGANDTHEKRSFVTIKVNDFKGNFKVLVSCVTKDQFRQHPYELIGDGCRNGICQRKIVNDMTVVFSHLGIKRVKVNEFKQSLAKRKEEKIDPFSKGFDTTDIDKNCVCLCFQVFLWYQKNDREKSIVPLKPVVSRPIHNEIGKLVISNISKASSAVAGNISRTLLCGKVFANDIQIEFLELDDKTGEIIWKDLAKIEFIHKHVAIVFKTPPYPYRPDIHVNKSIKCYIQLYRPSDNSSSERLEFEYYYPTEHFGGIKRKIKRLNPRVAEYCSNNPLLNESDSSGVSTSEAIYEQHSISNLLSNKSVPIDEFLDNTAQAPGTNTQNSVSTYQFQTDPTKISWNLESPNIVSSARTWQQDSFDDIISFNPN